MHVFRPVTALVFCAAMPLWAADPTAAGMEQFATELHRQFARGSDNLILSPFSNAAALSMLVDGARGQTATQLARALHQTYPDPVHYLTASGLIDQLLGHGNERGSELTAANGLWTQRGVPLRPEYERIVVQNYHASATQQDFAGNPEQSRSAINIWTSVQTKGKIQELFVPGSLGKGTRLVLTSAVYFHGVWQSEFHEDDTRPAVFHISARETASIDTMRQTASFGYAETGSLQVLEMKYSHSPLVFDVLLPKTIEGMTALEATLTPEKLAAIWTSLSGREVAVSLPRFRIQTDISLRDALSHMGVSDAFGQSADFSGMDDRRDLVLADVRHKALIDVTEQGTTAAGASGGGVSLTSSSAAPVVFRADHPFLFLIRDTHTGVILFTGRLMKPLW